MNNTKIIILLCVLVVILAFASIGVGRYGLNFTQIAQNLQTFFFGGEPADAQAYTIIT
ncbi:MULTISPECIES: hypothetical protein [Campylobacter]|uniref:hypothetical protein n=1 Tax=Campylobacter TaxID=194 RepID=UPI00027A3459|nr:MULTISPECIES: hypothetical protein [Campylobacter]EJP76207.1 hypothetical protein HMPREF1139_1706 [Campylobacter sp. FOBRC14]